MRSNRPRRTKTAGSKAAGIGLLALSLACLAPAPPPAEASPVGIFALEGIVLGASLDFVQDGHPTMFLAEVESEDPAVGTRYRAYLSVASQPFITQTLERTQSYPH